MDKVRKLINDNNDNFEHFSYYILLIEKAEKNLLIYPDISIESCKSLLEGICKTILISLDNTINEKKISSERYQFQRLFKESMDKLAAYNEDFELEFVRGFSNNIRLLGEIRTKRGDISHGKKAPKEETSSQDFAVLIFNLLSSLLAYIIKYFFKIEFEQEFNYEDYEDFNSYLDENNPLSGKVKYSLALYEQYLEDYRTQLKGFLSDQEELNIIDGIQKDEDVSNRHEEEVSETEDEEEISETEVKEEISLSNIIERYSELSLKENSEENLNKLCDENELYIDEVLNVIDTYLFDRREPLSDSIIKVLKTKPKLLNRDEKVKEMKEKIFKFIDEFIVEGK
ncbi:MAG: hypothetical protein CL624_09165 [Arcobacter sp.]|mgnify:CR=1 FL=1|nr:hypothetical protein [Arcobacter sp.]|tara:strand:+ start:14792 stop:15814 length:1023 start_codon:yes stop_codon:yes gene_type:complete